MNGGVLAVLALALVGCGACGCGAALPLPTPARAICYAAADQSAEQRVNAECKGVAFSACPAHDSIMSDLKSAQESCK